MPRRKKTAFIPQLRVPPEFADRVQRAVVKGRQDMPHLRRLAWEAFCEIIERGEQPTWPPRFYTEREYVHLSDALKFNGIPSVTDFYAGCAVAIIEQARKGHKIQWPPQFIARI